MNISACFPTESRGLIIWVANISSHGEALNAPNKQNMYFSILLILKSILSYGADIICDFWTLRVETTVNYFPGAIWERNLHPWGFWPFSVLGLLLCVLGKETIRQLSPNPCKQQELIWCNVSECSNWLHFSPKETSVNLVSDSYARLPITTQMITHINSRRSGSTITGREKKKRKERKRIKKKQKGRGGGKAPLYLPGAGGGWEPTLQGAGCPCRPLEAECQKLWGWDVPSLQWQRL